MKKTKTLIVIGGLSTFLLAGCFGGETTKNSEAFQKNLDAGNAAYTDGDFDKAYEFILAAYNENPSDETAKSFYDQIKEEKTTSDLKKIKEKIKAGKYDEASKLIESTEKINPNNEEVGKLVEQIEDRKVKQEKLDEYVVWLSPFLEEQVKLSTDWKKISDNLIVNKINLKEFKNQTNQILPSSERLVDNIHSQSFKLNAELARIHNPFALMVESNHDDLVQVLFTANQPEMKYREIVAVGQSISQIRQKQADLLLQLNEYAEDQGLVFELKIEEK